MRMRNHWIGGLLLAAAVPAVWAERSNQVEQDELTTRVEQLEAALDAERTAREESDERLASLEEFREAVFTATKALDQSVSSSRENGFEWAGPNPRSKTDLLEGLYGFGRKVRGEPEPEEDEESAGKGRR